MNYDKVTYPEFLDRPFIHKLWKKFLCYYGFHLFDEVHSSWKFGKHYLFCDACEFTVIIDDDPTHKHKYQLENGDF